MNRVKESKMPKRGKKYLEAAKLFDRNIDYPPEEAVALLKKISYSKFDGTVEMHVRLGVDPRHADQQVRSTVLLPAGLGKTIRILVFAEGDAQRIAEEAGADFVGLDDMVKKVQEGWTDFDMAIAVPQVMSKVGRLGRVLGPRGLMPSPKAGTITQPDDLPRVIKEARLGRVEFKIDKTANLHVPIGKANFTEAQLLENLGALMEAINRSRPPAVKGTFIRRLTLTATMAPGIHLDVAAASAMQVVA
jgi:large subunit ribosomal protein L1